MMIPWTLDKTPQTSGKVYQWNHICQMSVVSRVPSKAVMLHIRDDNDVMMMVVVVMMMIMMIMRDLDYDDDTTKFMGFLYWLL